MAIVAATVARWERTTVLKWLRSNNLGTYLVTRFKGDAGGEDEFGNRYYRIKGVRHWRAERRWVVYRRRYRG